MTERERELFYARSDIRGNGVDNCTYDKKKERKTGNIGSMFPYDPSAERQRASTSTQ